MIGWLFALCGAAAGIAQAGLLAGAAHGRSGPFAFFARYALVGVVLVAAALLRQIAFGAAGWIIGFVAAGLVVYRRMR